MRKELGNEQGHFFSDKELVDQIWKEKRDKVLGCPLPEALYIAVPTPRVMVESVAEGVLEVMSMMTPEKTYKWSQNWGKTKVVLGSEKLYFGYLQESSEEAKKTVKLLTDMPVDPTSRVASEPQGRKFFIVLNNEPSPIEGIVLQTERMVDELVWCLGLKYREVVGDPVLAHQMALDEVRKEGIDFYTLTKEQLLDLRRRDKRYKIRIYGNFNGRGKVPQVIGAIGPYEECVRPETRVSRVVSTQLEGQPQSEKLDLPERPFINMGICVAKRPHVGHMLLAGVVEIARRSMGQTTPIVIHANDTGPRIAQTIARAASERNQEETNVMDQIGSGAIDSGKLEFYYQTRGKASRTAVVRAEQIIKDRRLILPLQSQEHLRLFQDFWGNTENCHMILESAVGSEYGPQNTLNNPSWYGTGLSYAELGNKRYMLESNGLLTASATRSATLNFAAQHLDMGIPVFIDSDQSITDSISLLRAQVGIEGVQFPGTAVGFGMKVGSGTEGNSILMADFIESYRTNFPGKSLLEDVVYLLSTRYQLKPKNGLPFFDYADRGAFIRDIESINDERETMRECAKKTVAKLEGLIESGATQISYKVNAKKAKRADHQVHIILGTEERTTKNGVEKVILRPNVMRETPQVQSMVDKMINKDGVLREEAKIRVLTSVAVGQTDAESNIISELNRHGYRAEALIEIIPEFVQGKFTFIRINSLLNRTLESIDEIVSQIVTLDQQAGKQLIERYKDAYNRLFSEII